jgi:hypothetical protein
LQVVNGLSTALITISTLGAGLVYSTVFGYGKQFIISSSLLTVYVYLCSATRGDVQLMSYVFPFFSLGFMVPVIIQIGLQWAAGLPRDVKFASQRIWTIIIA